MDMKIAQKLIADLVDTRQMLFVINAGGAVSEMHAGESDEVQFEDNWATLESQGWHLHMNLSEIDGAQFVEAEDAYHDFPKLYYVRFSNADGDTLIRFYFPNPWLDENENRTDFQPEKLKLFEEFRERYVGKSGIVFVERPAQKVG